MVLDCFIMIKVTKTIMFTAGVMYYFANLFRFQGKPWQSGDFPLLSALFFTSCSAMSHF